MSDSRSGRGDQFHVSIELCGRIIAAEPNEERALIYALARYAGVRIPGELLSLTWDETDLRSGKMGVEQPKMRPTLRRVSISTELRPHLMQARRMAPLDQLYIVQDRDLNRAKILRSLATCIRVIGVDSWPRLLESLRASYRRDEAGQRSDTDTGDDTDGDKPEW